MKRLRRELHGSLALGLCLGLASSSLHGCDPGDIAEQCGLDVDCSAGGFAEGKASISGVAYIDAFFGAAIDLEASMTGLNGQLRGELDAIAASVGLQAGASGADIADAVDLYLSGYITGSLGITYQPAQCRASVEASLAAAAECDVEATPGQLAAKCEGSCEVSAEAAASCTGDATLMCSGTAPQLDCSAGTCSGSCVAELSAEAACDGTCRGSCNVQGTTIDGFEGKCDGQCQGECAVDMSAGGQCDFSCEGTCEYTAPEAGCEADATMRCEANAGASVECDAGCEGTVEPPQVSAECEASVDAKASASVECTPPTIALSFEWAAGLDASAQAEFRAWLEGFRVHFGGILAARAKAEIIADSAVGLIAAAGDGGALLDAVGELSGDANIAASIGAACALKEVPVAFEALSSAQGELTANLSAAVEVTSAL